MNPDEVDKRTLSEAMTKGLRNVAKLLTGSVVSQIIGLAATSILSRLFTPDEFGIVGVFLSVSAVIGVVAALRLELAVVVPESDEEAQEVIGAASVVIAAMVVLTLVGVLLGGRPLAHLLGEPAVAPLFGLLPFYVGSLGAFQVFNYWSTRVGEFGRLATAQMVRGIVGAAGQVGLGVVETGAFGLLGGQVLGQFAATLTLLGRSARGGRLALRRRVSVREAVGVLRRYDDFVIYGAPQALLSAVGQGLPAIILTGAFGAGAAGQYLLASRIVTAPSNLLGQSIRQVLYPYLSERLHDPLVYRFAVRITLGLLLLAAVPMGALVLFGPRLFAWGLGTEWRTAGVFSQFLSVSLLASIANIPAVSLVPLLRIQKWHAVYESLYLVSRVAALVFGGLFVGPVGAVAGMAMVGFAFNLFLVSTVLHRLRARFTGAE